MFESAVLAGYLTIFALLPAHGSEILVPDDHLTIQAAIDAAFDGDRVLVKPGTYLESIDFKGKRITVESSDGPHATRIDGQLASEVVRFSGGETGDSIFRGFTVTGSGPGYFGSGISITNHSDPRIEENIIRHNGGHGILCAFYSVPEIRDNLIEENGEAGVAFRDSCVNVTVTGNRIERNGGAGVSFAFSQGHVTDNLILENQGPGVIMDEGIFQIRRNVIRGNLGAGIYVAGSDPDIVNNIITWNAGGIHVTFFSDVYADFNTLAFNHANRGGGISIDGYLNFVTVTNSILWGNTAAQGDQVYVPSGAGADFDHCDVEGGLIGVFEEPGAYLFWGSGMIDADPLFLETEQCHLGHGSPCRSGAIGGSSDFENDPRSSADMGGDEFHPHFLFQGSFTPGGSVTLRVIGDPGTNPVGLFIGSGTLEAPIPTTWGEWFLAFPCKGPLLLGGITAPDGCLSLPCTIPTGIPVPLDIPMQVMIGNRLSNLYILSVE